MSEFLLQIEKLLGALADPEFRYLALEPVITYGLLAGVGMLAVGFLPKASRLRIAALIVIALAALTYTPYKEARIEAQPRMEKVYRHSAAGRVKDFADNTRSWISASWQFRLLVLAAFLALLVRAHQGKLGFVFSGLTLVLGLFAMKNAMWLNYQDALAYHPNLKQHEAPVDRASADRIPPPARETKAARRPVLPRAEPLAPSGRGESPGAAGFSERIQPPAPPGAKGAPAPATKAAPGAKKAPAPAAARKDEPARPGIFKRKVEPLPHF